MENKTITIRKITHIALFAALSFAAFTFIKIRVPTPGGGATALHMGNVFCVLAALVIGGWEGGLAGALGMTIGDLFDPVYILVAPKTFVLKFFIGLITGLVAHKYANINDPKHDRKYVFKWATLSATAGMLFNVIFDPLVGYFYKQYILGQPQEMASVLTKFSSFATLVNAIISVLVVSLTYNALLPVLRRSKFL